MPYNSDTLPISVYYNGSVSVVWDRILEFQFRRKAAIWDPTYGDGHLWNNLALKYVGENLTVTDLRTSVNLLDETTIEPVIGSKLFDGIIYDPPYLFGYQGSTDPRAEDYGQYSQSLDELHRFISLTTSLFPRYLVPHGKIVVKCGDQYVTDPEQPTLRRLYLHHVDWIHELQKAYDILDLIVYKYPRISPAAYLMSFRNCSVICHSYFITAQLK